mgnify:CR=1 FL=1
MITNGQAQTILLAIIALMQVFIYIGIKELK